MASKKKQPAAVEPQFVTVTYKPGGLDWVRGAKWSSGLTSTYTPPARKKSTSTRVPLIQYEFLSPIEKK